MIPNLINFLIFLIAQKVLVALIYKFLLAFNVFKHVFGFWN